MGVSCGTRHGAKQWINLEPCGLFCGSITWFLIAYGMYATSFAVIIPWLGYSWFGILNLVLFNASSLVALYAHIQTMITNPGAVPKFARPLSDDTEESDYEQSEARIEQFKKFCRKCKAFKPKRAHHCSICGRCIVKMDHHCPWVNNCVGLGNHKLFVLFVFWILMTCLYSLVLTVAKFISCSMGYHDCSQPSGQLIIIFLVIEGCLFGLFTICMLGDQLSSIFTNQTQIDRLKNTKFDHQTEVNEVFGSPSHVNWQWSWLLPVPVTFKDPTLHQRVHGYRCEEGEEMSPLLTIPPSQGTPAVLPRNRKTAKTAEVQKAEEAPSDDESYKADTITEWLDDVNSILSDHTSGPEDIEMASMAVTANSTSVYQRVKNEGSEGEGGKKVSPNCSVPGYLEQSLIREKKK